MEALSVAAELDVDAEGLRQVLRREGRLDRAGRHDTALAQHEDVGEARRDFFDVVRDEDERRSVEVLGECAEATDEIFTGAEVEPCRSLLRPHEDGDAGDGRRTVLVVEDEGAQREVLQYNLESEGFEPVLS